LTSLIVYVVLIPTIVEVVEVVN